jgi:hypothetical protein
MAIQGLSVRSEYWTFGEGVIKMGQITWNTDVNAPGCPGEIVNDDGRTVLLQTDWDYPGVASTFGWDIRDVLDNPCDHNGTDGTVDCECGVTASEFIAAARQWLDDNDGAVMDDPGYFDEGAIKCIAITEIV